ncbi:MAG TPA: hypothetical protein DCM39_10235, partial [Pantoea sp.]|nr:hypothetical protein [Pantoea sp.]
MSLLFQGLTQQRLFKLALLASAIHATCSYAAQSESALLARTDNSQSPSETVMTVTAPEIKKQAGSKTSLSAADLQ